MAKKKAATAAPARRAKKYIVRLRQGCGQHDAGGGVYIKANEELETDQPLFEMFPDKFDQVDDDGNIITAKSRANAESRRRKAMRKVEGDRTQTVSTGSRKKAEPEIVEEDLTVAFPTAQENGLTVIKVGDVFIIKRGDEVLADGLGNETLVVDELDELIAGDTE
jgi:hypothetical protein